jgi:hypothetical protein
MHVDSIKSFTFVPVFSISSVIYAKCKLGFLQLGKKLNVRVLKKIRFPILFQLKGFVH